MNNAVQSLERPIEEERFNLSNAIYDKHLF